MDYMEIGIWKIWWLLFRTLFKIYRILIIGKYTILIIRFLYIFIIFYRFIFMAF